MARVPLQPQAGAVDHPGVAPASDQPTGFRPGRTNTALDDRITRLVGQLPMAGAFLFGALVYVGIGLTLPLSVGAKVPLLISLNMTCVLLGWSITVAWLFSIVQSAPPAPARLVERRDLRSLSVREFEWLVGDLLTREGWDAQETGGNSRPCARRRHPGDAVGV